MDFQQVTKPSSRKLSILHFTVWCIKMPDIILILKDFLSIHKNIYYSNKKTTTNTWNKI